MNNADWNMTDSQTVGNLEANIDGISPDSQTEMTVEDMEAHLTRNISKCIKETFELKSKKEPGNKIPWEIIKKLKMKSKISKRLIRSKDGKVINTLCQELLGLKLELKES